MLEKTNVIQFFKNMLQSIIHSNSFYQLLMDNAHLKSGRGTPQLFNFLYFNLICCGKKRGHPPTPTRPALELDLGFKAEKQTKMKIKQHYIERVPSFTMTYLGGKVDSTIKAIGPTWKPQSQLKKKPKTIQYALK